MLTDPDHLPHAYLAFNETVAELDYILAEQGPEAPVFRDILESLLYGRKIDLRATQALEQHHAMLLIKTVTLHRLAGYNRRTVEDILKQPRFEAAMK